MTSRMTLEATGLPPRRLNVADPRGARCLARPVPTVREADRPGFRKPLGSAVPGTGRETRAEWRTSWAIRENRSTRSSGEVPVNATPVRRQGRAGWRAAVGAVAASLVAAATVASVGGPAGALPAGASYVALGDSYTSGPFIPLQLQPYGCLRSDHNYPQLAAAATSAQLTDMSCAGATTDDMTQSQHVTPGPDNPAQLDPVTSGTQVVTLGI